MRAAIEGNDSDLLRRELMALAFMVSDTPAGANATPATEAVPALTEQREAATAAT